VIFVFDEAAYDLNEDELNAIIGSFNDSDATGANGNWLTMIKTRFGS
jgi:hypothetical protein